VLSAVRIVRSPNQVELVACYVRTDCVQRGLHCLESKRSGSILFSAHRPCSARFALVSVVMKWNYLVPCAQTALSAVRIVLSRDKVDLSCSVRTDSTKLGSNCSESEQSCTSLLRSHRLRSARFALFRVVTKRKYLVQCARTVLSAVRIVQCCNEVELSCSVRTDCAERGSYCSESGQSRTILFRAHGLC